jgi:hypothetical protein
VQDDAEQRAANLDAGAETAVGVDETQFFELVRKKLTRERRPDHFRHRDLSNGRHHLLRADRPVGESLRIGLLSVTALVLSVMGAAGQDQDTTMYSPGNGVGLKRPNHSHVPTGPEHATRRRVDTGPTELAAHAEGRHEEERVLEFGAYSAELTAPEQ